MERIKGVLNQRKILFLLLALLIVSLASNGYLFVRSVSQLQEETGEEESYALIPGYDS
jgi:hypothetical protein